MQHTSVSSSQIRSVLIETDDGAMHAFGDGDRCGTTRGLAQHILNDGFDGATVTRITRVADGLCRDASDRVAEAVAGEAMSAVAESDIDDDTYDPAFAFVDRCLTGSIRSALRADAASCKRDYVDRRDRASAALAF